MDEPDPISEIELLSRNFLSHDSNLDEYEDVDTNVLSPRRVPIGRGMTYGIGSPGIPNVVSYDDDDNDDEDNKTHSSGFSSSIQNTVKEIDGVLDEIRVRSSPDPNDFVFRSGNRQYYNGYYYDDDAMTEKSYLTNTNLHQELNEANEIFNDTITAMQDGEVDLLGNNQGAEDSEYDLENDTSFDLGWLRSKVTVSNDEYERRKNTYENNRIDGYENNHIDTYENNDVYSPDKTSHREAEMGENKHNTEKSFHQEWKNEAYMSYPSEIEEDSDSRDYWNDVPASEMDLEEALSRVDHIHRRRNGNEESLSTSYFGSKLFLFWRRRRRGQTHRLQSEEAGQHHQGEESQRREELSLSTPSYSSSRKETRLLWAAIGCSTVAIVFVSLAVVFMTTATSWSSFTQNRKPAFAVGANAPIDNIDSNNTHVNFTTVVYVDDAATSPTMDPLTNLPTVPTMPSNASTTRTEAPTALPTRFDAARTEGAEDPPTSSPVPVSTASGLPVSGGSKPNHPQAGSTIEVVETAPDIDSGTNRPVDGNLPVSGVATSAMHYVSANNQMPASGAVHVKNVEEINSIVIDNIAGASGSQQPPVSPPVFGSLPVSGRNRVDASASGTHHEAPTSSPTKYEKYRPRRELVRKRSQKQD